MYEKVYTSPRTLAGIVHPTNEILDFMYSKAWDAVFARSQQSYWRIFRDANSTAFGAVPPTDQWTLISRVGGYPAYLINTPDEWFGKIYPAYNINCLMNKNDLLNPNCIVGTDVTKPAEAAFVIDDINNVLLIQQNSNAVNVYYLDTAKLKYTLTHNKNVLADKLHWVAHGVICGIRCSDGKVWFLDYLSGRSVFETGMLEACKFATYDCLNNVFITLTADWHVRVYVREAWPTTLGNPEFIPTTVRGRQGNTVRVKLSGDTGEPCPDWWVHWLLEVVGGVGPYGYLDQYVTKTDAEGYAWNTYIGPRDGETGQTKLSCRVVIY